MERPNFSEHTLDINLRRGSFHYADIEQFVDLLVVDDHGYYRDYQAKAIRNVMAYLWGGGYENIQELAKENYSSGKKPMLQRRYLSEEIFLQHLPLADRLSGVVHMATGTGKSFVLFAVAYLSLVMGLTKRVLIFGPSSTIIEQGLRDKFRWLMNRRDLQEALPAEFRNKPISLLTDNDVFEEQSIVIENINVIFGGRRSAIRDAFQENPNEDVLVLGDEIHHAYSHLEFHGDHYDVDATSSEERLWMKFIKDNSAIKRHIGFTGTPYNADEHFADIIFDYSIMDALEERQIKRPNPIKSVQTDGGGNQLSPAALFKVVIERHNENRVKFAYPDSNGLRRVKPITIFISASQQHARSNSELFKQALVEHTGISPVEAEKKVLLVISNNDETEYKEQLAAIEQLGTPAEFVFSVFKLSEGWDVDNVFQIVPMQDVAFNSKLRISQVLGRGLRLPRKVLRTDLFSFGNAPTVTITNHERFGPVVESLLRDVINTEMHLTSGPLPVDAASGRGALHFPVVILRNLPIAKTEDVKTAEQASLPTLLQLQAQGDETVEIVFRDDTRTYEIPRRLYSLDSVVDSIDARFRNREWEQPQMPLGEPSFTLPQADDIRGTIVGAMEAQGIFGTQLTLENRQRIDLFYNQQLPPARQRRVFERIDGDLNCDVSTATMDTRSVRVSDLDDGISAFISESYRDELSDQNLSLLTYIEEKRTDSHVVDAQAGLLDVDFVQQHSDWLHSMIAGDGRSPFVVQAARFKSPQSIVFTSYDPERQFVFALIEMADYLSAWVKSPDQGFYSIDYEYWREGKDRKRAGFNPDFLMRIDLQKYISVLDHANQDTHLASLNGLLDAGVQSIIHIVEIKSDEDHDPITDAKERAASDYVKRLNTKLAASNVVDIPVDVRSEIAHQRYVFTLLRPENYVSWKKKLRSGELFEGLILDELGTK
ncbi:MAG: DEAD/DEAH box helicase family protein [Candidatus Pacebacteria bacterium]|nr:DEAD/DEAH box helicase family protein [Candidatus Paceibacterota bacterium]